MTSPVGIEIGKGNAKYKVGKQIGSGACASVYELQDATGQTTEFAVKIAPIPKATKKGTSIPEKNVDLIHYEHLIYNTQFVGLQGKYIPSLPKKGPPSLVDAEGHRMFVMERMEDSIESIVPALIQNKSSSKSISVGPIAVRLLECVKGIHECKNIARDIKAENFMLARDGAKGAKSGTLEERLAARVRLLDLALAQQYTSAYREDKNASGIVGTPLYASLNVHNGEKATYRDDLEALGYVIAELLIKINAGNKAKKLPWSDGKSDDDIGSQKRALVEDPSSSFYKLVGDTNTAAAMMEYLTVVRGYSRKKFPDYDQLEGILRKLTVPRPKTAATKAAAKKSPKRTPTRRSAAASADTVAKRGRTSRTVATQTSQSHTGMDIESSDSSDVKEMDWEPTGGSDENEEPDKKPRAKARKEPARRKERVLVNERVTRSQKKQAREEVIYLDDSDDDEEEEDYVLVDDTKETETQTPALKRRGVRIRVVGGPHKGDCFVIEDSGNETIVIGSKPSTKVGTLLSLAKDKSIAPTHLRLDLSLPKSNKMKPAVSVTNKSKDKVYVNSTSVNNTKAFIGNEIMIGNTILKVEQL